MKNNRKKKAFTLTELLVVVIVIGVLSAVVLPKFNKVIETRKTTEAEEMMAAVRTEQERRCALDKDYTTDAATVNLASLKTKNFNYTLKNTGIEAASTGKYGYTLKMPSYRDGRLCCDSAEQCAKLNKNYPLCSELTAKADYTIGEECSAGEVPDNTPKTCEGSSTQACGCKNGGTRTRTCDTTTGTWSAWSACSIADSCECKGVQPASFQSCNTCGTQTRPITCNSATGEWVPGEWGACDKTAAECNSGECTNGDTKTEACGNCGTQEITCINGRWIAGICQNQGECKAGTMSFDGGALCTNGGGFVQKTTVNNKLETSVDTNINANFSDNINGGNTNTGSIKTYSGRVCNDKCQWEDMSC
ncbi:prepilin-type N-terminal cleavage/methylation domain-containing protein, partial [Candidatus Avelusimicrobium fimicolum]|uniref:prepilin-type N-terminal cleavage/methylation domain-containing protein n=1 Tax=Candidatus Avelusimicrobium fimicolum TaxID=3416216 RepID=UPI003D0CE3C8